MISFAAPEIGERDIPITRDYVRDQLKDILTDQDLKRFIL